MRQIGASRDLGLLEESGGVLWHQVVKRGVLGVVAPAVRSGTIWRALGLAAAGLHDGLPRWCARTVSFARCV